ncbi:MAG: Fic family protein [Candidatus Caenarcaniphilales bacterium]|nr:Fic family protein [Candidatus Caenarcaniphilales bacterium]
MPNKKQPWYKNYKQWKTAADQYMKAAVFSSLSSEQQSEVISYGNNSIIRLIFESNRIEGAGTKTLGETERMLEQLKKKYKIDINEITFTRETDVFSIFETKNSEVQVTKYGKSFKEYKEVMQHWSTVISSMLLGDQFLKYRNSEICFPLFSEKQIKAWHEILARGLTEPAGEYRREPVFLKEVLDLTFPNHELLDKIMDSFCNRANRLIDKGLSDPNADKFMIAAQITYEFVRIHPFVDFNGRTSRIFLRMIMQIFGLNFSVILRGNKKAKDRYMWALKHANAIKDPENFDTRHLEPYATLIAMAVCDGFKQINANLRLAGLPTIGTDVEIN